MMPFRGAVGMFALLLLGAGANPLQAAWCNVFQVCCNSCGGQSSSSYYVAPQETTACAPACCPQPVCTTRYVTRSYYQPVTTYQTRTYYEPVTSYKTSYYYEPVTSYRYSMYYDPCTCSYKQQACPTTCYQLRSQCCPVQSWVQRCCSVPVTTQQVAYYLEPVTSCSNPCANTAAPALLENPPAGGTPALKETPSGERFYQPNDKMQRLDGNNTRQLQPRIQATPTNETPPPPTVKLDRIAYITPDTSGTDSVVVRNDQRVHAGAKVLFISAERHGVQETTQADGQGQFRVSLASGEWLVYVYDADGKPVFQRKIEVKGKSASPFTLVSR